MSAIIDGVGTDAPTVTNERGGKQSHSPFRCDLLPPRAVLAVASVLRDGAAKYGDGNWRSIPVGDHLNHALSHVFAWLAGDTQDDHLAHAACRLVFALDLDRIAREGIPVAEYVNESPTVDYEPNPFDFA